MKLVDMQSFVKLGTPPAMLISKALPESSLMVVVGEPYVGKSLLALDLALSVSLGEKALHQFEARQANVVYVAADAPSWYGAWQAAAMLRGRGYEDPESIPRGHLWFAPPGQGLAVLDSETNTKRFIHEADQLGTELVVLDTLRKMHSLDENSSGMMTMVVDRCRMINEAGIGVILIHHTAKAPKEGAGSASYRGRGSTVVPGEVDINWLVEKKPQASRVTVAKGRGASLEGAFDVLIRSAGSAEAPQILLHWAPVPLDEEEEPAPRRKRRSPAAV